MIFVIQCAAKKKPDAGHLRRRDGQPVLFVADPALAPTGEATTYARPDEISDTGISWRAQLLHYNKNPENNPLGLLRAADLYKPKAYTQLVEKYGFKNVYILSAGWGLIAADFLTPTYNITFSSNSGVEKYKLRRKKDHYDDLCMLPVDTKQSIVFFGGKNYVPLFCSLTESVKSQKYLLYNSKTEPIVLDYKFIKFNTTRRTNWHYECVSAFIDGNITIPD
jgi:hypothetical protein